MVPMDAVIVSLESNASLRAARQADSRQLASGKDDLVITPGGPRPRDQVRPVKPGEVVHQNEDGTFTVVPKEEPSGPQPKGRKKEKN